MSQKKFISEALNAHNELRAKHGVDNLEIDNLLCKEANNWAEHLAHYKTLEYNDGTYLNQPYGENILRVKLDNKFYYPGIEKFKWQLIVHHCSVVIFLGNEVTNEWYQGGASYQYDGVFNSTAGNFTQLVWLNSRKVGFGFAISENGYFYAVANYFPGIKKFNLFKKSLV